MAYHQGFPRAMPNLTLSELRALVTEQRDVADASARAMVDLLASKTTKDGKPYLEVHLIDARDKLMLRAWSDAPVFALCADLAKGAAVEISGDFSHHAAFGLDARRWTFRRLSPGETAELVAGPKEVRERQAADFQFIAETTQTLRDPRLRILCEMFLVEFGDRFKRAAAARTYHHARRGGLVEHTAQMMRAGDAVARVYPRLNRDLLLAGALFHDAGKLWENHVAAEGFGIEHSERGEMLGHITMGVEIINQLWRQLKTNDCYLAWKTLEPATESVRLHLLHLVASHHGEMAFGSPVVPKTPEAAALHYIDNLDAKLEMIFNAYATTSKVAPNVYDRVRPLPGNLIEPLPPFTAADDAGGEWLLDVVE